MPKVAAFRKVSFHLDPELKVDGYCNRQFRWMFLNSGSYRTFMSQRFSDNFKDSVEQSEEKTSRMMKLLSVSSLSRESFITRFLS